MGGRRLSPGQSVDALEEAIDVIRLLWDVGQPGAASFDSSYYRLRNAARGPAPLHDVGIWVGAYKPRMLNLTGRKADGWLVNERATNSAPELHASQGGESGSRG